jgi:hypothetical protein
VNKRTIGLSKSKITLFEQCPKRLWLSVHRPDLAEESDGMRAGFAAGHQVGDLACSLYPDGIMISAERGVGQAVADTAALLASGWDKPVFEATFAHDGVLVRVDLLLPDGDSWHVAEVKNTTGVKDYHHGDLATQLWVMRGAGVPISTAAIRHLDRTFMLTQADDYTGLFMDTMILDAIEPIIATRAEVVASARAVLEGSEPEREMGGHCASPFTCSFQAYCGRDLPPTSQWPVTLLPDAKGKYVARHWLEQGVDDLTQVPASAMPNVKLARIHGATLSGHPWHDRDAIRADIKDWTYPRTFLDFEAIQFAIPRWLGTRPFAQIPFQFSAHIETADGKVTHRAFLSLDGSDPRRACAEALVTLPAHGAVVAWSAGFERGCLTSLAAIFPDLAPALTSLADRLVDPLPVVRRHYYHRDMRGSWSLKNVLPTLEATGYSDLGEVTSGTDAQAGYLEAIDPATPPERTAALRDALLSYCQRDTEAMMIVLDALTR